MCLPTLNWCSYSTVTQSEILHFCHTFAQCVLMDILYLLAYGMWLDTVSAHWKRITNVFNELHAFFSAFLAFCSKFSVLMFSAQCQGYYLSFYFPENCFVLSQYSKEFITLTKSHLTNCFYMYNDTRNWSIKIDAFIFLKWLNIHSVLFSQF